MKPFSVLVVSVLLSLSAASRASADDVPKGAAPADARTLSFADGAVKATVDLDPAAGRLTFRVATPNVTLEAAPVLVLTTDAGARELELRPATGEPGTWIVTDDALKAPRLVATIRIVLAGRTHTAALPTPAPVETPPGPGRRKIALGACATTVDVVIDARTGTLTLYVADGQMVTEALLLVPDAKGTVSVALAKVEGSPGAFAGRHEALSAGVVGMRVRVTIDGKACDGDLTPDADRPQTPPTGFRVKVDGGPTFEVTRGPKTGEYGFHAVDETFDGGSYVIEGPTLTADGRVYTLVPVEGETRTWRLVDLEPKSIDARDVQLSFSIQGKSFVVRFDLAGPTPK